MPRPGGVGLFCQSAAVGVADAQRRRTPATSGCPRSSAPATTPTSPANDVMQYWEDDDATRVCLLSLDSIGNPRKFSRITRRLTRRKPVVVFAPGRAQPVAARRRPRRARPRPRRGRRRAVPAGRGDGGAPARGDVRHRQVRGPAAAAGRTAGAGDHQLRTPWPQQMQHTIASARAAAGTEPAGAASPSCRPGRSSPQAAQEALADPQYDSVRVSRRSTCSTRAPSDVIVALGDRRGRRPPSRWSGCAWTSTRARMSGGEPDQPRRACRASTRPPTRSRRCRRCHGVRALAGARPGGGAAARGRRGRGPAGGQPGAVRRAGAAAS